MAPLLPVRAAPLSRVTAPEEPEVEAPEVIATLPELPVELMPLPRIRLPEDPVEEEPLVTVMAPLLPVRASPLSRVTAPEEPEVEAPERSEERRVGNEERMPRPRSRVTEDPGDEETVGAGRAPQA